MSRRKKIKYVLCTVIVLSYIMMFFSVGKYELELISFKEVLQSFAAHFSFIVINGILLLVNDSY